MKSKNQIITPDRFIFMKVGDHAQETWDSILERKQKEIKTAGVSFWGYGGNTCHPLRVQEFSQYNKGKLYLLMQKIKSNDHQVVGQATEYSVDGQHWSPIPKGVTVTGSKYALLLGEIQPGELLLSISQFKVGIGPNRGKPAMDYLRGRVDKACLELDPKRPLDPENIKQISVIAKVTEPYAVFVR